MILCFPWIQSVFFTPTRSRTKVYFLIWLHLILRVFYRTSWLVIIYFKSLMTAAQYNRNHLPITCTDNFSVGYFIVVIIILYYATTVYGRHLYSKNRIFYCKSILIQNEIESIYYAYDVTWRQRNKLLKYFDLPAMSFL